jgi:aminoglycoside phosphotransferase (APT) family kinase protein
MDLTPTWIHGDPHPRNLRLAAGRLVSVIDWDDM